MITQDVVRERVLLYAAVGADLGHLLHAVAPPRMQLNTSQAHKPIIQLIRKVYPDPELFVGSGSGIIIILDDGSGIRFLIWPTQKKLICTGYLQINIINKFLKILIRYRYLYL